MILYNVTVKIEHNTHQDWLAWMKATHIPEVMKTGIFKEYKISRLLYIDETDGITYAIQYVCDDMNSFRHYQDEFAKALQADHTNRYKDKFVAFRTLMEVVDQSPRKLEE